MCLLFTLFFRLFMHAVHWFLCIEFKFELGTCIDTIHMAYGTTNSLTSLSEKIAFICRLTLFFRFHFHHSIFYLFFFTSTSEFGAHVCNKYFCIEFKSIQSNYFISFIFSTSFTVLTPFIVRVVCHLPLFHRFMAISTLGGSTLIGALCDVDSFLFHFFQLNFSIFYQLNNDEQIDVWYTLQGGELIFHQKRNFSFSYIEKCIL